MPRKKTHEEFVKEIETLYPNRYSFLTEYNGLRKLMKVKRNSCNHILEVYPSNLYYDSDCPICTKNQNKQLFINNFTNLADDEFELVDKDEYINANTKVHIKHKTCGTIFPITPHFTLYSQKITCPKCENSTSLVPYVNDIYTLDKEMYELLKDKNDGHKHSPSSTQKTWFVCPFCKKEHYRVINKVHLYGICCDRCSDNISYPEKYMGELLSQLGIVYTRQFNDYWTKAYRYDFYFTLNNENFLIEMDGGFHFNQYQKGNNSLLDIEASDKEKDELATKNGFHLIRINSNYPSMYNRNDYLKKNVKKSELCSIFDLSIVDFNKCNKIAQSSFIGLIAQKWNEGIKDYSELAKIFSISEATIRNYIITASNINLISEHYDDIKHRNRKITGIKNGIRVRCNETNEIFSSFKEADRKYNCNVSIYFSRPLNYTGILEDGTKLTWTKL